MKTKVQPGLKKKKKRKKKELNPFFLDGFCHFSEEVGGYKDAWLVDVLNMFLDDLVSFLLLRDNVAHREGEKQKEPKKPPLHFSIK